MEHGRLDTSSKINAVVTEGCTSRRFTTIATEVGQNAAERSIEHDLTAAIAHKVQKKAAMAKHEETR